MNCQEARAFLALAESGLQPPEATARYGAHLDDCRLCRGERSRLRSVYQAYARAPEGLEEAKRGALWQGIAARLEEAPPAKAVKPTVKAKAPSALSITLALSCSYCHGALARSEAVYCASCLSAHHDDCFATHGRCSIFGCEEGATVRPRLRSARPKRRAPWLRNTGAAALTLIGLGSAAYTGAHFGEVDRQRPVSQSPSRTMAEERVRLVGDQMTSELEDLRKIIKDMVEAPARERRLELAALESQAQARAMEQSEREDLDALARSYAGAPRDQKARILEEALVHGARSWYFLPTLKSAIDSGDPELVALGLEAMVPAGRASNGFVEDFARLARTSLAGAEPDWDQRIRIAALRALAAAGDRALGQSDALLAAAASDDVLIREAALRAIGEILKRRHQVGGDWARTHRALRKALDGKDIYQTYPLIPRRWALAYLANVIPGRIEVSPAAIEVLDDGERITRKFQGETLRHVFDVLTDAGREDDSLSQPLKWWLVDERIVVSLESEPPPASGREYAGRGEEAWEALLAEALKRGCEDSVKHLQALARSYLRASGRAE